MPKLFVIARGVRDCGAHELMDMNEKKTNNSLAIAMHKKIIGWKLAELRSFQDP